MPKILLNNDLFQCTPTHLPCLITGAHQAGASFFTVCLAAQLIQAGHKLIFFTAYPMAKEELINQIGHEHLYELTDENESTDIPSDKTIIIKSGDASLRHAVMEKIEKKDEYILLVKNYEQYDHSLREMARTHNRLIFSGNIDACPFGTELAAHSRQTTIWFSPSSIDLHVQVPKLEKYQGYLVTDTMHGMVHIEKDI